MLFDTPPRCKCWANYRQTKLNKQCNLVATSVDSSEQQLDLLLRSGFLFIAAFLHGWFALILVYVVS